jgi:transposase
MTWQSTTIENTTMKPSVNRLITEREAAAMIGLSIQTLRHWRVRRVGPAYLKFGRGRQGPVRYALEDLLEWAKRHRVETRPEGR